MNSPKPQKSSKKVKNIKAERKKCPEELRWRNFHRSISAQNWSTARAQKWTAEALHNRMDGTYLFFNQAENYKLTNHRAPSYTMISPREYVYYYRLFIYSIYFYLFILECRWRGTFSETQMRLQLNQLNQSQTRVVIFLLQLSLSQKWKGLFVDQLIRQLICNILTLFLWTVCIYKQFQASHLTLLLSLPYQYQPQLQPQLRSLLLQVSRKHVLVVDKLMIFSMIQTRPQLKR